jgi:chitinase
VVEGDAGTTAVTLMVTLSAVSASEVTVDWATADGSANGSDYTAASGTLTFAPGETSKTITLFVTGDTGVEPTEAFTVSLSAPSGATIGDGSATVTITDDDVPAGGPTLSIADLSVVEGDKGKGSWVYVTVTLSEAAATDVTVDYVTVDGTATAGSDYEAAAGTLYFAVGATTATIRVRVLTDRANESDETFSIVLSNAAGASIADGTAAVTIVDDDGALFSAAAPEGATAVDPLSLADAETMLEAAVAVWVSAGADAGMLDGVTVVVGDLPAGKLADVDGSTITLDADAAGWGWFVDDTPWDADEFQTVADGALVAGDGSAAAGRIDLLTVLLHELGHLLGFGHDSHGLMAHDLEAGIRLLPWWHDRRPRPL